MHSWLLEHSSNGAARYGNTIGDMASYDAFTLGGPYSVRGFNVGELATARRFVEAAAELRVPVFGRQAYAFIEHGTDLGEPAATLLPPSQAGLGLGLLSLIGCAWAFALPMLVACCRSVPPFRPCCRF